MTVTTNDPMLPPATVALFGAGGRMGCLLTDNLSARPEYEMRYIEVSEAGIAHLAARGLAPTPQDEALQNAEIVILAVSDPAIGPVAREIVPLLRSGTVVVCLDPAAPYAGELPERPDIAYFVAHPCHPPVFNDEEGAAREDYFGGSKAKQHIVCALQQGTEKQYEIGERVACAMYAPVINAYRLTVEQMTLLEPTMAETVAASCITVIREALDEVVKRGVPAEAAREFLLGHINTPLAIVFGKVETSFSPGAKRIIEHGKDRIFRDDWKQVFESESVKEQVKAIVSTVPVEE